MYSIRIRTNKRLDEYQHGDKTDIAVLLRNGKTRHLNWGGFTLEMQRPIKLIVEAYTLDDGWDPRDPGSRMPRWQSLTENEYLLGSLAGGRAYTLLPFRIVVATPADPHAGTDPHND